MRVRLDQFNSGSMDLAFDKNGDGASNYIKVYQVTASLVYEEVVSVWSLNPCKIGLINVEQTFFWLNKLSSADVHVKLI